MADIRKRFEDAVASAQIVLKQNAADTAKKVADLLGQFIDAFPKNLAAIEDKAMLSEEAMAFLDELPDIAKELREQLHEAHAVPMGRNLAKDLGTMPEITAALIKAIEEFPSLTVEQEDFSKRMGSLHTLNEQLAGAAEGAIVELAMEPRDEIDKTIFVSPGGKKRMAPRLVKFLPEHKVYTEVFAGSAAVFFQKEPAEKSILNDRDTEIAFAYRAIRDLTDAELNDLKKRNWVSDKEHNKKVKAMKPKTKMDRLYKFLYLAATSFGGMRGSGFDGNSQGNNLQCIKRLEKFAPKLEGVKVYCGDYEKPLIENDGPNTVHFLDPPYPGTDAGLGESEFDEERFIKILKRIKGKFVITYGTTGKADFSDFFVRKISVPRLLTGGKGSKPNAKRFIQLLVTNFDTGDKSHVKAEEDMKREKEKEKKERARQRAKDKAKKGFPNEEAEVGVHVHNLEREKGVTKLDGLHRHLFRIPFAMTLTDGDGNKASLEEGALLLTEEDGPHIHNLSKDDDGQEVAGAADTIHRHIIKLPESDIELITATDGEHSHELQTWSSGFDGAHEHELPLGEETLKSLNGEEFWKLIGSPDQDGIPPAPPASELAQLDDDVDIPPPEEVGGVDIANKATWSTAFINDLPDSAFLYIEPGGEKDEEGKTTPRSLRHFPYKDENGKIDLPHLRNAVQRIPQSKIPGFSAEDKKRLQDKARRILADEKERLGLSDDGDGEGVKKGTDLTSWDSNAGPKIKIQELANDLLGKEEAPDIIVWKADPPLGKLPALKVPDPNFLIDRLQAGEIAGILSRVKQNRRVGKPQVLVNEVRRMGLGSSYVWGVVVQEEPIHAASVEALEPEQQNGLDRFAVNEFGEDKGVWFLPLRLLVMFDPPISMRRPPSGRRFAGDVDFETDLVRSRQISLADAMQATALREVHSFINDPSARLLKDADDKFLLEFDARLHDFFAKVFAGTDATKAEGVTRKDTLAAHVLVVNEMAERSIGSFEADQFGKETTASLVVRAEKDVLNSVLKQEGMVIQTLIFDKQLFSRSAARRWAREHEFVSSKVDETETSFRLRQREPSEFQEDSFRTIDITEGVKAVVGRLKKESTLNKRHVRLLKWDRRPTEDVEKKEERYVFGVILVPDEVDAQGDIYNVDEVRKAAHGYMEQFGRAEDNKHRFKIMHKGKPVNGVVVLETYLSKVIEEHNGQKFPVGTWFLAARVENDDIWSAIKRGAFDGFSMGGTALRERLAS